MNVAIHLSKNKLQFAKKTVLISLSVLFLVGVAGCYNQKPGGSGLDVERQSPTLSHPLVNFSNVEHRQWLSAERDDAFEVTDDNSLRITFSPDVNTDDILIRPATAWNLSKYSDHNFAFDVKNYSATSTQLYVALEDTDGNRESRSVNLPAKFKGTVYFPITGPEARDEIGLWGVPEAWPSDDLMMVWRSKHKNKENSDEIAVINFRSIGLLESRELAISDIRLRSNPQRDGKWLEGIVDKFGQNARSDDALKVNSEEELREIAQLELKELAVSGPFNDRSRFGGYANGPKLKATGYFRVEKLDGKWWMVDPDGYLFFSHGPANVRMANMTTVTGVDFSDDSIRYVDPNEVTPEDSMGIVSLTPEVRDSRFISSAMRNNLFEWLPSYDHELADHYSYRRSTHVGPVAHGETFSFYRANLERRYGQTEPQSYLKKWQEVTLDRMNAWGFTSFGNWVDPAFYPNQQVPYFANGWIIGDFKTLQPLNARWSPMPDFFDPVFAERAQATISVIAEEVKASPWCIGIFIDNEKAWGELDGGVEAQYGVITDALSKDRDDSPAKAAFTDYLKSQYKTINALNEAWDSDIADWAEFSNGVVFEDYTDTQVRDLSHMLEMLGEQYFKVVHSTLEKYLPNHLYMGARMANWGMPPEIIKASVKYSDVLSFNIYEEGVQPHHWAFLQEIDLPTVIGEFHIGTVADSGMFSPGIVSAYDQVDRARMYTTYMESVLAHPNMVGAHWFQYMDEPITGRTYDGENANIGFVNVADIPYPELIEAAKKINSTLYSGRYGD